MEYQTDLVEPTYSAGAYYPGYQSGAANTQPANAATYPVTGSNTASYPPGTPTNQPTPAYPTPYWAQGSQVASNQTPHNPPAPNQTVTNQQPATRTPQYPSGYYQQYYQQNPHQGRWGLRMELKAYSPHEVKSRGKLRWFSLFRNDFCFWKS